MTFANSSFDSKDTSDSLYMFNRIKGKGAKPEALAKALRDMNQHGSMSILASDGTYLLAYRDMNRSNSLYYKKFPGGYVVCSEPIFAKRASWTLIQPGEFVIFNKGQIV
jgi:predicted glutamine amidotransferase